jgi:pimeloyl-ACP methyl ester carboxylesterase
VNLAGTSTRGQLASSIHQPSTVDTLSRDLRVVMPDQAGRMRQSKRWNAVLPRIEQPVLILVGSEDKLLCAEDRDKLHQLLAREQLEIIEESGHFLYLDSPHVVSNKIVTFTRGGKE